MLSRLNPRPLGDYGNGIRLDSSAAPSERLTWLAPPVEGKELTFLPTNERWLRACLEASCLQLPRFFASANQIIFDRAPGVASNAPPAA